MLRESASLQKFVVIEELPTRYHIPSVQRIVILDEAKAVHKLHFGNVAGAILGEMGLDILLRHCREEARVSDSPASQPHGNKWNNASVSSPTLALRLRSDVLGPGRTIRGTGAKLER